MQFYRTRLERADLGVSENEGYLVLGPFDSHLVFDMRHKTRPLLPQLCKKTLQLWEWKPLSSTSSKKAMPRLLVQTATVVFVCATAHCPWCMPQFAFASSKERLSEACQFPAPWRARRARRVRRAPARAMARATGEAMPQGFKVLATKFLRKPLL